MNIEQEPARLPVGRPPTAKGKRTRLRILHAARVVFAESGYVGARMSDVASRAGMSMGGLYRYFGDKEGLFEALIGDLHEELFARSTAGGRDFAEAPYEALLAANRGYLATYAENRDVMRAFIEAANVDDRFRAVWWAMRTRHVERFAATLRAAYGVTAIAGSDVRLVTEAMACMVEECAFVWYAHAEHHPGPVDLDEAARIVTRAWYQAIFGQG